MSEPHSASVTDNGDSIAIRRCQSLEDYRACQEAQRRAWGIQEDGYVVPVATMVGAQHHGGLVLGAFRPDGEAVGLSFAFMGRIAGKICLYSQLTGVVPGLQGQGIGHRLKMEQWRFARDEGIETLAWAFDPMRSGNAWFNLHKLGAEAGRYLENMYGPRTDALNANAPTDRLIAEWSTRADDSGRDSPSFTESEMLALPKWVEARSDGTIAIQDARGAEQALLEAPDDLGRLQADDPALVRRWSESMRWGFQQAFAAGFRATGFERSRSENSEPRRCFYRLTRR